MGLFITIEGGEYTGKTSVVIPGLTSKLKELGITVETSREPGGTVEAEKIRAEIFRKSASGAKASELAELFNIARKLHLHEKIIPFLGKKKEESRVLILDRYLDSTRVYQGLEGGVPLETIYKLEDSYIDNYFPDLTLILYFPLDRFDDVFEKRTQTEREKTTWDSDSLDKHKKRQEFYLQLPQIAKSQGENRSFLLIDASKDKNEVVDECIKACLPFIFDREYNIISSYKTIQQASARVLSKP